MKILAARGDRDLADIKLLYPLVGFKTADEGLDLVAETYPEAIISPRTQFFLEEMFPKREPPERGSHHRGQEGPGLDR
jgi:hypothetical protein